MLFDFIYGLFDSIQINLVAKQIFKNTNFKKLVIKLLKYNFLLHIIPLLLTDIIFMMTNFSLHTVLYFINYPINLFSAIFHVIHFIHLTNIISINKSKTNNFMPILETVTLAITMSIYQLVVYLTTKLINYILYDRMYILAIMLNFFILTIYHSFYCFNNLWQHFKIEMFKRIDIHEKLWPYYMGYGIVATIIYFHINNPYFLGLYNMYIAVILSLPFLFETKFPHKTELYPKINLMIFSYIVGKIFSIAQQINHLFKFIIS